MQVINLRLTKENYFSLSPAMTMGIAARDRMIYSDGSNHEPAKTSGVWRTWFLEDNQVKTWIVNSVSPEIQPLILRKKTARDMWVVLEQMPTFTFEGIPHHPKGYYEAPPLWWLCVALPRIQPPSPCGLSTSQRATTKVTSFVCRCRCRRRWSFCAAVEVFAPPSLDLRRRQICAVTLLQPPPPPDPPSSCAVALLQPPPPPDPPSSSPDLRRGCLGLRRRFSLVSVVVTAPLPSSVVCCLLPP
ncbi:hypothetical protein EJ110_NYTH59393 [Nymphaea thermarum]|nr:hypothetical protein EJ110_NYTH59393 [Nymphaea thermarum]